MEKSRKRELRTRNRPVFRATILLGVGLISAALLIAFISYRDSYQMMERSYQSFYMSKAEMIVSSADPYRNQSDKAYLAAMARYWEAGHDRPKDEYICVVDRKGNLLLHTGHPNTVGDYAGDNPILGDHNVPEKRLCDLVLAQRNYVGQYISSSGHDQIAAFVAIPGRNWMLGVHRSRDALTGEIADSFRPLLLGFVLVCGLLMPACLVILYRTFSATHQRQISSELALRESERNYQSLVDAMPQCLYRTDLQGRLIFANLAFLQRQDAELEQCLGRDIREFFPARLSDTHRDDDVEVIRSARTVDRVEEHPDGPDGHSRFIELVKSPVRDGSGGVAGVQGIFWDVTDKRRAEQRLECTMAQLKTVLGSVPSGILAVGVDGRLVIINPKAEEIFGFTAEEALGRPLKEFIPDTGLTRVLERQKSEFGKPYKWGDKRLLVSRSPIYEGSRITGAVSVVHDESELESVQKQLDEMKRLNDEYSSLVDNSHDGVLIADCQKVIKVNASFGRITGLAPSALEGRTVDGLERNHDFIPVLQEVCAHVRGQGSSLTIRRQLSTGNEIFVTVTPVKNSEGKVVRLVLNLRDVTELQTLEEQIKRLSVVCLHGQDGKDGLGAVAGGIVAESPLTKTVISLAMRVARVDSTVLLCGDSGVGKDVLARLIHGLSRRREKPFVSINCGAIPENLLESELFGYEKGAFTGADREGKPGLFEEAAGGTILLDEVGEMPLPLQVKLLKVIQERQCRRLGGRSTIDLDIRVLAATNRDLKKMVKEGRFREDLFYRLYVVPIEVPPLRQRREDILPLALRFLKEYNRKYQVTRTLGQELLQVLEHYDWPGNVRELQNVVERMVVTADNDVLEPRHLPDSVRGGEHQAAGAGGLAVPRGLTLKEARDILERGMIEQALAQSASVREAAKALGVSHPTVLRKAAKLGVSISEDGSESVH